MRHSWSVPVLLALTALAGYAAGARPVEAQGGASPLELGEVVTFSFQDGGTRQCRIEEIRGLFARCGSTSDRGPTIGRREPPAEWVNVAVVEWITKRNEQR